MGCGRLFELWSLRSKGPNGQHLPILARNILAMAIADVEHPQQFRMLDARDGIFGISHGGESLWEDNVVWMFLLLGIRIEAIPNVNQLHPDPAKLRSSRGVSCAKGNLVLHGF